MDKHMNSVVIVGGGHAAAEAAIALRIQGWEGDIKLISDEDVLPYQRPPLSKGYFHNTVTSAQLLIKKQALYEKANVDVMLGLSVVAIDRLSQAITVSSGAIIGYSQLIIATGAQARMLNIPGAELPCVSYLRTLNDANNIIANIKKNSHLLVIGGGYIGLEIAASARKLGARVTILESFERVLSRVTNEQMSGFYQSLHKDNGVDLKLNTGIEEIHATEDGYVATLNDGSNINFDHTVVGIGVIPNTGLAEAAGLECDNGIVVNEYTLTSDPSIYAIGDVSNHPNEFYARNIRLESVPNAMEQAKVAAANICGKPKIHNSFPWFWSDQYNVKLQTAGLSQGYDETIVRGDMAQKKFALFYLKEGKIIAVDAINSPKDFMKAKALIPQGLTVSKDKLADITKNWFD
jgi:3-phenylpropionate/trans-cinnamate dioxygenase ferredoxin reductase subunit